MSTHDHKTQISKTTSETFQGRSQHPVSTNFLPITLCGREIELVRHLQTAIEPLEARSGLGATRLSMPRPRLYKTKTKKIAANRAKSWRSYLLYVLIEFIVSTSNSWCSRHRGDIAVRRRLNRLSRWVTSDQDDVIPPLTHDSVPVTTRRRIEPWLQLQTTTQIAFRHTCTFPSTSMLL